MASAIGYIRVSTEGQATDGVSLDAQRAKIEAWALLNDYDLVAVHVDAGISGKSMANRPGLQAALNDCKKGSALVVYAMSRMSRSTKDTIEISERLSKAGADLVSLSEKIDTTSAAGKMVFRLMAVLNEHARDVISENTTNAMRFKKSKGELVGAVPYGYRCDDGVNLTPDDKEQEAITLIKELNGKGLSLRNIASRLEARGYIPRGKAWYAQTISNILAAAA